MAKVKLANPNDEKTFHRLREAKDWSRQKLEPFRNKRMDSLRQYVGFNYSQDGAPDKVPINLLELATNIYVRQLAADRPRVLITTKEKNLKRQAIAFEKAMEELMDEIHITDTRRLPICEEYL